MEGKLASSHVRSFIILILLLLQLRRMRQRKRETGKVNLTNGVVANGALHQMNIKKDFRSEK